MKKESTNAAQALADKHFRAAKYRHMGFIATLILIAIVAVICIIAVFRIKKEERIQRAQNLIAQFEINTTVRTAELDADGDEDGDGVLNAQEQRAKTNPRSADTDEDGLSDGDEAALGTDPNNPDTDGDSLLDGYELLCGLDPTKTSTDGSTADSSVVTDYSKQCGELTLDVSGNANIADVSICEMDIFNISSNSGIVGCAYDIAGDHEFSSAAVTFKPDKSELENKKADLSKLTVLRFDSAKKSYQKIDSTVDTAAGTVSAQINVYGTYALGRETTVSETPVTQIAFLLDNSGSMYPVELCEVSPENDVDFKRLDFAKSLMEKTKDEGDYLYSIAKFTGTYTLMQDFTDNTEKLYAALEEIRNDDEIFDGSHIETALSKCMDTFEKSEQKNARNMIVLLSDGASDETGAESIESLAKRADDDDIIIMTIGLGREADRERLQQLASLTGGKYYSASDADALESVYEQIVTTLNYDLVDYSETDEPASGYALYNTGFDPVKNGFAVKNFRTSDQTSMDFGIAVLARDWFTGSLAKSLGEYAFNDGTNDLTAPAFDLNGTDTDKKYSENKPLSSVASIMLSSEFADVKQYLDYDSKGLTLKVNEDMLTKALDRGWSVQDYKLDANNFSWEKVELLSLNITGAQDKIKEASSADELELLKAIYRFNAGQWNDDSRFDLYSGDDGFEMLEDRLNKGIPVVTVIDDSHTVNTIGMIQDSSDHRKFILQIYDNNYPGAVKNLYVTRAVCAQTEDGKAVGAGYSYSCEYEGKQVGVSFSDIAY